ncbi:MAG TPA: TerB family tellurite resistance protein [Acidimicrobiia bacterium]|nr:TerB family tellurite resistance protein [Acidimicrobiia bacterium]
MLLIFGTRARLKAVATGEFFCSGCGADRSYVLQQIRRWFTFFFVPLFPIGKVLGEQVKCSTCGSTFRPEVLNTPTSAAFSETLKGATRVAAVAMLVAGDRENPVPRAAAIAAARKSGSENYDESWLARDISAVDPSNLDEYLAPLAKGLNAQGKEVFIEQIARIGLADGQLSATETQLLEKLGAALGISAVYLRGIVVSITADPQAPSAGDGPPDEHRLN